MPRLTNNLFIEHYISECEYAPDEVTIISATTSRANSTEQEIGTPVPANDINGSPRETSIERSTVSFHVKVKERSTSHPNTISLEPTRMSRLPPNKAGIKHPHVSSTGKPTISHHTSTEKLNANPIEVSPQDKDENLIQGTFVYISFRIHYMQSNV